MSDEQTEQTEKEPSKIDLANAAAERMEQANAKFEALLERQEQQAVEQTLAGKSDVVPEEKKEETPEEYAKRVMNNENPKE